MKIRYAAFFISLFCSWVTVHAQVSYEDAMERMKERQAARAAAATQPDALSAPATRPASTQPAELSICVQQLESHLTRDFSGSIGAQWTPDQTAEWLNKSAEKAASAVIKLVGVETTAKIVVDAPLPDRSGITGHLFLAARPMMLTNADRLQLKVLIRSATVARIYFESVQGQWNSLQQQRDATQAYLDRLKRRQADPNINREQLFDQINQAEARLWDIDHRDTPRLASELQDAQAKSDESAAKEKQLEDQLLQADKQRLADWGPVVVRTSDTNLLSQHHGAICSVRVRVEAVDVAMIRIPDGAAWNFSSDVPEKAEIHSPTAGDDSGPGAVPPYVSSRITVRCVATDQG